MRWNLKPVPVVKTLAATLSLWTMCMGPVAQGAQAARNKELINEFLKESGLTTQKMTIGEFWAKARPLYPPDMQKQLDIWARIHKNEPMPKIDATTFRDSDNKEQVRLLLTRGTESSTVIFTGDDDMPVKVNNVTFSREELTDSKKLQKAAERLSSEGTAKSQKRFLTGKEIAKLPLHQQMDYILKMRTASEAADRVLELSLKKNQKGALFNFSNSEDAVAALWQVLLGSEAVAKGNKDNSCIAAGWIASYYNGSCARPTGGQETLLKQIDNLKSSKTFSDDVVSKLSSCATGGGLPCNPLLYGFQPSGTGEPYCIQSDLKSATKQCSSAVPLPAKKEQIIQSIAKARGGQDGLCKIKGNNEVSQTCFDKLDKYTKQLEEHYLNAAKFCTKGGVTSVDSAKDWEQKARKDLLKDQIEACDNLKDRFFDLKVEPPAPPAPPTPATSCAAKIPGSHEDDKGNCVCSDGKAPRAKGAKAADGAAKPAKKSKADGGALPPPPAAPDKNDEQLTCEAVVPVPGNAEPPTREASLPPGKDPATVANDACGWFCRNQNTILKVLGVAVGVGIFAWLWNKFKTKTAKQVFTPPAPPPLTPTPSPSPAPVTPVPTNPCPFPNTMVNGICTPPSTIPSTPPAPTEGGQGQGPSGGGVKATQ